MTASAGELAYGRRPRLGFLGAGWIGRMRMRAVAASETAEIVAIADPARDALAEASKIAPTAAVVLDLDHLLTYELDGIVIATPSGVHAGDAISALRAGAAVFCQKPVGRNAQETAEVIGAARRGDRLLATDFAYRFTQAMQSIHSLIQRRALGKIYAVDLCFHNSYGPDKPWYYNAAISGGGCVIDLGTHLVDLALWTLDFPAVLQVSSRLFCEGRPFHLTNSERVEDFAFAEMELQEGTAVRLACSWGRPLGRDALIQAVYHGEHGAAEFHNLNGSFYDFAAQYYRGREQHLLCSAPDDWNGRALLAWIERLGFNNRFAPDAAEIEQVAKVVDAIYRPELRSCL